MAPTQQHSTSASVDSNSNTSSCCNSNRSTNSSRTATSYNTTNISSSSSNSSISSGTNSNINSTTNRLEERGPSLAETSRVRDDLLLPITCRGQFYHDAFFKEARQHFEAAVRDVLDHWGQRSTLGDDLTCYRKLRESNLTETSQAVTVSQDHTRHQVVMDVRDFLSGDVKVKVVDENELVVEGSVEQRREGSVSNKSFRRRFSFPGLVRPEAVTSTMSSDGVLTVTVPKNESMTHEKVIDTSKVNSLADSSKTEVNREKSNTSLNIATVDVNTTSSLISKVSSTKDHERKISIQLADEKEALEDVTTKSEDKKLNATSWPDATDLLLPISHKGLFFHDSFFEDVHKDFETAVKKVLDTWGETCVSDDLTCYRSLRERNLQEENQAVSLTEDHQSHKVVMDVRDFLSGDVKVKVVDENELVVEGSVEQRQEGSVSTKSFRRRFSFPGLVRPDAVTSTMSSDGVLTVIVPKKESVTQKKVIDTSEVNSLNDSSKTEVKQEKSNTFLNKATVDVNTTSSTISKVSSTKDQEKKISIQLADEKEASEDMTTKSEDKKLNATSWPDSTDLLLPISHKGLFFHDSFFEDVHKDFETAVKKVLDTWGETCVSDDLTCYRSLRERNLQEENQAVSLTEDHQSHKVVMDVRDFLSGDVKVKVVDENELVVEGSVEQRQEGSVSNKSFRRRFSFPGLVRPDAVTSSMSSDGVLTVTVPKKQEAPSATRTTDSVNDVTKTSIQQTTGKESSSSVSSTSRNMKQSSSVKISTSSIDNKVETNRRNSNDLWSPMTENLPVDKTFGQQQIHSDNSSANVESRELDSLLPISKRGLFFHDSFFQDVRQDFETAVKEVLDKFVKERSSSDDLSLYRNLRECDLRDENQAMKVTENQHNHQVVIDVGDFMKGDVQVKVVDKNEVVVEGRVEKQEGNSRSSKSFRRGFTLPGAVDGDALTAAMSSDGVLTITAPKASGGEASIRRTSQEERTLLRQEDASGRSFSRHEESCHEEREERGGSSSRSYSHTSTSHQRLVSSSKNRQ